MLALTRFIVSKSSLATAIACLKDLYSFSFGKLFYDCSICSWRWALSKACLTSFSCFKRSKLSACVRLFLIVVDPFDCD